jgi:hypothetical protein
MADQEKQKLDKVSSTLAKFKIENVLSEVSDYIQNNLPTGKKRFQRLESEFKKKFPENTALRGAAEALTWAMLSTPLALFFLGQNSAVFVELHGFLERYVLRDLPHALAKDKQAAGIISSLIERRTLSELSEILLELKIWNDEDVRFARKLANVRNGIVHKNAKLISKHLSDGRDIHLIDIENLVYKADVVPYIIGTIELLVKLSGAVARAEAMEAKPAI